MGNSRLGFALLMLVVILWVASSNAIQMIFKNISFNKPFFLTYFSTTMFSIYLITLLWKKNLLIESSQENFYLIAKTALKFCPLWFFANYFFNLSLGLTRVASNTVISSSSSMFTLIFSIIILKEKPVLLKFVSVIIVIMGVSCVALSDTEGIDSFVGDAFALLGAIVYATYSVFLKSQAVSLDMTVFFGCVGAINAIVLLPGLLFVNFSGIEEFEFPNSMIIGFLALNALFGTVLSDLLWALSVKHLNPALCTVGLSLTIPLSMTVDKIWHGYSYSYLYLIGALMIVCGFIIMSLFEYPKVAEKFNSFNIDSIFQAKRKGERKNLLSVSEMSKIVSYWMS
ncbi:unnamed protein product [Blepharisma stoltei]|uniref:Sugar phosphate transporter domain-containing protein n=1 Tax=Blepharisma stoltei TaxID=1481888 RepID=A0AAU9KAE9_9CILI|nr:unnamed protein product [Blepharisma stoltei]